MKVGAAEAAAAKLLEARTSGRLLARLGEGLEPQTAAEAHEIQDALIALLGEPIGGWKVAGLVSGNATRGAILSSRLWSSPARIDAMTVPLAGIEAEIAFRFDRPAPARAGAYDLAEVRAMVTAVPAIEIVDTRFASLRDTPVLHRVADFMSNGALICGEPRSDWRSFDLSRLPVILKVGREISFDSVGKHANGDPILPALALANELRLTTGIEPGHIVTTGSLTGLVFAKPGDNVVAEFGDFGRVEVLIG